jgi:alkylated DNA repair dioxygenase AlkB
MSLFSNTELFTPGSGGITRYDLPDAELVLYEQFFSKPESDDLYEKLLQETHWKQEDITLYGKTHLTPRLTAWYGDTDNSYSFSGKKWHPHPWTPELLFIKERIEKEAGVHFTGVLLNLYRNGKDSVGWHCDNEKEFGNNPVIGSVSFGATRTFQVRHKSRKDLRTMSIPLTHGSFLLMSGAMQHSWEHQVSKTARPVGSRINLTFRVIY